MIRFAARLALLSLLGAVILLGGPVTARADDVKVSRDAMGRGLKPHILRYLKELERQRAGKKTVSTPRKAPKTAKRPARNIVFNGVRMTGRQLTLVETLERKHGVRLANGAYWYDPVSGLVGARGSPLAGRIRPGLSLGGRLRYDASGSRTNVVVNGRAIHPQELALLQAGLGRILPGRYFLRSDGSYGYEGGRVMGNLLRARGQRGRSWRLFSTYDLTGLKVF